MIQITIDGIVGIRFAGRTYAKTKADGPFKTDKETEKSLVRRGFAEYVDDGGNTPPPKPPKDIEKMDKKELYALAQEKGLEIGDYKSVTAAQIRAALKRLDEVASDGQSDIETGENTENEASALTGDNNAQSGEIAENGADSDPENAENGADGDQNADMGTDNGEDGTQEEAEEPPAITAEDVVE